jgi:transposase-like protein
MAICTFCNLSELKLVGADPPWTVTHFICPTCDSTYNVEFDIEVEVEFDLDE